MEERSSEGERQSGDEQLAGDAEQKQAGPTGPGAHKLDNEELLRDSWDPTAVPNSRKFHHHAKFGGAQISPVAGAAKKVEFFCLLITGSIARSATRRYLIYSEADFLGFSPRRGDTLHRWG